MRSLNKIRFGILFSTLLLLPSISHAQNVYSLVRGVSNILERVIPITMAIALIVFMWGIIKLVGADSDDARAEGKQRMLWGVIALFVLVSIWGITRYMRSTLGISNQNQMVAPDYPRFRGGGGGDGTSNQPGNAADGGWVTTPGDLGDPRNGGYGTFDIDWEGTRERGTETP